MSQIESNVIDQSTNTSENEAESFLKQNAFKTAHTQSFQLIRRLGFGLLVLSFFDLCTILIPSKFLNPYWELQTIGELIGIIPIPLIGLTFIFFGKTIGRSQQEKDIILPLFSILSLILAVAMFLFIPLGLVDAYRIDSSLTTQIKLESGEKQEQLQKLKAHVDKVSSTTEMEQLVSQIIKNKRTLKIKDSKSLDLVKSSLIKSLNRNQKSMKFKTNQAISKHRLPLLKNTIKWILGALVSGVLFMYIWRWTMWVWR